MECESDAFKRDPRGFTEQVYFSQCISGGEGTEETCFTATAPNLHLLDYPDFIVCNAEDLGPMKATLNVMEMDEIGRYINGVNGIRIGQHVIVGSEALVHPDFTRIEMLAQSVVISLDEMVLFKRSPV